MAKTNDLYTNESAYQAGLKSNDRIVDKIGAYHMIGNSEWEPQRSNNYEVHIYGLTDLVTMDQGIKVSPYEASEGLTLSVASFGGINMSVGQLDVFYGNTKVKYAGLPDFADSSVTVNDFIGRNTERILTAWFGVVFNPHTEAIGRAVNYKKPAVVIETAPDGTHSRIWKLNGCWPKSLQFGDYSAQNGGIRQVTMALTYDTGYPLDSTYISK